MRFFTIMPFFFPQFADVVLFPSIFCCLVLVFMYSVLFSFFFFYFSFCLFNILFYVTSNNTKNDQSFLITLEKV